MKDSSTLPYYADNDVTLYHGDCREVLPTLPAASVDAVICDPPYPCVEREYGAWTEPEWHGLMRAVVGAVRRVLKPSGSAVFVLQPNSERAGRLRPWLWDFLAWASREWNVIQDAWWWNHAALPVAGCTELGLLRPSLKACVWLGAPTAYRNQAAVLWEQTQRTTTEQLAARAGRLSPREARSPAGLRKVAARMALRAEDRGGVTPYNVLPFANNDSGASGGALGHGAATPLALCAWWLRYLTPPGGSVLDPFSGSGTVLRAAKQLGRRSVGIEAQEAYCRAAVGTLGQQMLPLAV